MGMVSFFDIGMQTHICSPNGGQTERDIRAIPPTGKSPGPTYLYPPPPIPFKAGPCVGPRRASCVILRCQVSGSRRTDQGPSGRITAPPDEAGPRKTN